jgi:LPS-assembly lipoprotein
MSSPEGRTSRIALALALLAPVLAGCTELRPMYADPAVLGRTNADLGRTLSRVRVVPIDGRVGVELRNNLIFELTGGGLEPAAVDYELTVTISQSAGNLSIEAVSGRPTSAQLAMVARYRLTRLSDGAQVGTGSLSTRIPYDQTVQRFANIRAQRDAEDRAARELAVAIRNGIVAMITNPRPQPATPPAAVPAPAAVPTVPR